jgi:hypothetical protein
MQHLLESFFSDKAPLVLTLFVAAIGWTTARTTDRLSSTPFLEYRLDPAELKPAKPAVDVRVRNITTQHTFGCVRVMVVEPQLAMKKFFGARAEGTQVLRGTVLAKSDVLRAQDHEWEVEFTDLGPGADIAFRVPLVSYELPKLLFRTCPPRATAEDSDEDDESAAGPDKSKEGGKPPSPVLVEQSFQTWFVEHEIPVLWSVLVVWLMLLIARSMLVVESPARRTETRRRKSS